MNIVRSLVAQSRPDRRVHFAEKSVHPRDHVLTSIEATRLNHASSQDTGNISASSWDRYQALPAAGTHSINMPSVHELMPAPATVSSSLLGDAASSESPEHDTMQLSSEVGVWPRCQ